MESENAFCLETCIFFGGFLACPNKKTSKVKVCLDKTNGHSCPGIVCRPANIWSPVVEIMRLMNLKSSVPQLPQQMKWQHFKNS